MGWKLVVSETRLQLSIYNLVTDNQLPPHFNMPSLSIVAGSGARNLAEQLTLSAYSNQGGTDYAPGFKKFPKYTILFVVHIKQNCVLKYLGNFLNPGGIVWFE